MPAKFQIYKDAAGKYRFRLVSEAGESLVLSEGYGTKEDTLEEIRKLKETMTPTRKTVTRLSEETIGQPPSKKIFIVHGKDNNNKNILKNMLSRWGLKPIVLAEEPNRGSTLIEKLILHTSDVGYAFVLMTPDDFGLGRNDHARSFKAFKRLRSLKELQEALEKLGARLRPRVRQNVMFEYGLCVGALKKEKVCQLVKGDIEIPSDLLGRGYLPFQNSVLECKEMIRKELQAAGYEILED